MGILEIIAEQSLGAVTLQLHPELRDAFDRAEEAARHSDITSDEKARIAAIVELCFEYHRETDLEERANILRTLEELGSNEPLELPTQSIEEWEADLLR